MKKRFNYLIYIFIFVLSFFWIDNIYAIEYGRVTNTTAALRSGPGTNYSYVGSIYYNDVFPVLSTTPLKSESGCSSGWYKINYYGKYLYACSSYISTSPITARVSESSLNIRNGAGTNYSVYENVSTDKLFTLTSSDTVSGDGCSSGWYKIEYNGSYRYVCSSYLDTSVTNSNAVIINPWGTSVYLSNSTSSTKLGKVKHGQALTVLQTEKFSGAGCPSKFYKVFYKGEYGYVCAIDIARTNNVGLINEIDGVNVRTSPSVSSSRVTTFNYMDAVPLVSTSKYTGSGCSSGWYKFYYNNTTLYVCSSYVSLSSNVTSANSGVVVRSSTTSSSKQLSYYSKGTDIILDSDKSYTGTGCSSTNWYKVNVDGDTGYICGYYAELPYSLHVKEENNSNSDNSSSGNGNSSSGTTTTKTVTSVKTDSGYFYTTNKWSYRVNQNYANIRKSASVYSSWLGSLYLGTEVEVLGTETGPGCSSGWYKIKYYNNKTGYMCKTLIDKYEDVTKTDTSYCSTLKEAGFPESYCPYLSYLHSKYSNWKFVAEKTGVTFLNAVNGESEKNYTQNSYSPYVVSTDEVESGGWMVASDGYVAYMIDPRNYLNEYNIFAFEDLAYDSKYHTIAAIRSIVSGSYLDDDTYAGYFLNAGIRYNVSPVHLASRVKQEGGTDPNYDSVSGKAEGSCTVTAYMCSLFADLDGTSGTIDTPDYVNLRSGPGTSNYIVTEGRDGEKFTLDSTTKYSGAGCSYGWYKITLTRSLTGIYNFYNIGAYGSNPVNRGLKTAAGCLDSEDGTPWDTPERAIKYGASFIANGYVNKGQNTMYYQKFNTGPNATAKRYTHQYMTNILAPAGESLSTYESYADLKLLNKSYVFKIPVYDSMPTEHTMHPNK